MRKYFLLIGLINLMACKDDDNDTNSATSKDLPKIMLYSVVNTLPHNENSFTQGLCFYKGKMYEGTGLNDKSKLMEVDLKTGKAMKTENLSSEYFGEGVTVLNDIIYQLTWKNNVVFCYNVKTFKKIKEFKIATEGWGITNNGSQLIVSDGTNNLYFYNPKDLSLIKTVAVTEAGEPSYNLNELEFIDGYIYANEWMLPYILKIDANTGNVLAKADLTLLWQKVNNKNPEAVPNGIAYNPDTKKIYITGKLWTNMFEVQFSQ